MVPADVSSMPRLAILVVGWLAAAALVVGWRDRVAALLLAVGWFASIGRNLVDGDSGPVLVAFVLLAHACTPPAPFLSWAARGRVDPDGGWRMPPPLFAAAWLLLTLDYAASGVTRLTNSVWRSGVILGHTFALGPPISTLLVWGVPALELAFVPLALFSRTRALAWCALFLVALTRLALGHGPQTKVGLVLLHGFTFDSDWLPPRAGAPDRVFYDGSCALCHRLVRFVLAEDRTGGICTFAPLQGSTFAATISAAERAGVPDSVVVLTEDRRLLLRSSAQLHLLDRLG